MAFHFNAAFKVEEEQFGDAILTTLPERLVKAGPMPGHPRFARLEPRGAVWVEVEIGGRALQVINTHLGPGAARTARPGGGAGRQGLAGRRRPRAADPGGRHERHAARRRLSHLGRAG